MEIDSSIYESCNYVEFPKIMSNSINTFKSNSLFYINDITNNSKISLNKSKNKIRDNKNPYKINKMKNELKLSIAQKIAKNKINHMNYEKIKTEIFKYKNQNLSNKDPINKYITNFKTFDQRKINKEDLSSDFIKINKDFIYNIKNINLKKKKKEGEKFLNLKNIKFHNYYLSRMINTESQNRKKTFEENIIFIQKNIRGFLMRSKLNKEISRLLINYIINNILKIQKAVRKLLKKKNYKKELVVKIIRKERKDKANKITDILSVYHFRNEYKKFLIIKKILNERIKSVNKIYFAIKNYLYRKKIKEILQLRKNNLEIIYPIDEKNNINLKIYYNNNMHKIFNFKFCQIRKVHVLYINKNMIGNHEYKNQYLCQFFVNGDCVVDKRYKIIKDKFGIIYNIIEFNNKEKLNNVLISNNYKDIKKNKYIERFEKMETKTISYNNNIFTHKIKTNFYKYTNFKKNNFELDNKKNNNSIIYNHKTNIISNNLNNINKSKYINKIEDLIETKNKRRIKNKSDILQINLENLNNSKHNKINSYGDSYINSYNDINNFNSISHYVNISGRNAYQNIKINENISDFLGNSSSTISNSNYYKNTKINQAVIKEVNEENIFDKKNKKIKKFFPIYY